MARNIITFELRKDKDDDIASALDNAVTADNDRSSIIRVALRKYFNPSTYVHATRQVVEQSMEGIVLQVAEKDDAELDVALDNLFNF